MSVIHKLSRQNLKHNKNWSIYTILGITLATAMITAVVIICFSFYQMYINDQIENFGTNQIEITSIHEEGYQALNQQEQIEIVSTRSVSAYVYLKIEDDQSQSETAIEFANLTAESKEKTTLLEGRYPENSHEVIIPNWMLEYYFSSDGQPVSLGEKIQIPLTKEISFNDGQYIVKNVEIEELTLVGILKEDPANNRFKENVANQLVYSLDRPVLAYSVVFNYQNLSSSIYEDGRMLFNEYHTGMSQLSFNNDYFEAVGITESAYRLSIMSSVAFAGGIVMLLIMLAGVSLIRNAFSMAASQRVKQLGMLSSVGATKHQKKWILYGEGLYLSLVGIICGLGAGYLGMSLTFYILEQQIELFRTLNLVVYLPWYAALMIAFFALLMVYLSFRKPARLASKITPIDSIRETETYTIKKSRIIQTHRLGKSFGIEGEIAQKYMQRNRRRYRPTQISLVISIILFLVAFNFTGMMRETLELNTNEGADLIVYQFRENPWEQVEEFTHTAISSSYFKEIISSMYVVGYSESSVIQWQENYQEIADLSGTIPSIYIQVLDNKSYETLLQNNGMDKNIKTVLYDRYFVVKDGKAYQGEKTTLKAQDEIRVDLGSSGEESFITLPVGEKVSKLPVGLDAFANGNGSSFQLVTSQANWEAISPGSVTSNVGLRVYMVLNHLEDDQKAQTYLEENAGDFLGQSHLYNAVENSRKSYQMITIITVFVSGFISLISLICLVNIINTMSNNIRSRRKEFAILKSIGMDRKGLNKMLYYEALMYGIKAVVYSVPISLLINWVIHRQMNTSITLSYGIGLWHYIFVILLVMVIVLVTMLYVSRSLKKMNIIETIKDESM